MITCIGVQCLNNNQQWLWQININWTVKRLSSIYPFLEQLPTGANDQENKIISVSTVDNDRKLYSREKKLGKSKQTTSQTFIKDMLNRLLVFQIGTDIPNSLQCFTAALQYNGYTSRLSFARTNHYRTSTPTGCTGKDWRKKKRKKKKEIKTRNTSVPMTSPNRNVGTRYTTIRYN